MLSLIKLVLKIELLNQLVYNPQSNIHGYILRFHYIHYQYDTAFTKSFMFRFHVWISGVRWINRGGNRSNRAIITCALRCKRHFLRKTRRTFKNQGIKFNTCSRNTIPRVKISLNKNSGFTYFAQCKHSFPPCDLRVFRYSCFNAPRG